VFSKDLNAASATPLILSILKRGDSYGYEIISTVGALSQDRMQWADGMLYPILHRLEKKGWIKSYWGKSETGRRRKYYRLRKTGERALAEHLLNWNTVQEMLIKLEKSYV